MRVDRVIRDERKALRQVLEGLDHNLTARDNFAPEGQSGWVLTSRGPDQIPEYRPVTLSPESSIDWDSISGTPNTLAGYGIDNAYTAAQVNALIETHTHSAEDIVSGILDPPRLGSGAASEYTFLRGDSTWQPLTLSGLGIAGEVANFAAAAALRDVEGPDDWPVMIPGPRGVDGVAGAPGAPGVGNVTYFQLSQEEYHEDIWSQPGPQGNAGAAGRDATAVVQLLQEEYHEDIWSIPGAQGNTGTTGATGAASTVMGPPGMDGDSIEEGWTIPGQRGLQGPQGIMGPPGLDADPLDEPDLMAFGLASVAASAGGGGVSGAGTLGKYAKWTAASTLGDSLTRETATGVFVECADGLVVGSGTTGGVLRLFPTDNALEGGHITIDGGGGGGVPYKTWNFDSWTGLLRLFETGLVRHQWDSTYYLAYNVQIGDVGHGANWAGVAHSTRFNTTDYALLHLNTGLETRINVGNTGSIYFAVNNVLQYQVTTASFRPSFDGTQDLGANSPNRFKDVWLTGELVGMNGINSNTADQAGFANVATNITGCSFAVLSGETWVVRFYVPWLKTAGVSGLEFSVSAPATSTLEGGIFAVSPGPTAFKTDQITVINTFFGIIYGLNVATFCMAYVDFQFTAGGNGTVQLQGRSGAAATTIVVQRGAYTMAFRRT